MSKIEWTDETWNPVTGCTKVSPGCANCYAERMAWRLKGMGLSQYQTVVDESGWTGKIALTENQLEKPLHWIKPRRIFVCSMSDLFHEEVPDQFIYRVFDVAMETDHHIYQVLTKRPARMMEVVEGYCFDRGLQQMPDNVWGLVSAENQDAADYRIPILLRCPFSIRGVSIEPMLGPVNLRGLSYHNNNVDYCIDALSGDVTWHEQRDIGSELMGELGQSLDWVIVGGESGPGARPMHPNWVEGIRDQCVEAGVPFFFKQWGAWLHRDVMMMQHPDWIQRPSSHPHLAFRRLGKKDAGRELNGHEWNQYPSGGKDERFTPADE